MACVTGRALYVWVRVYVGRRPGCRCSLAHGATIRSSLLQLELFVPVYPFGRERLSQYGVTIYDSVTIRNFHPTLGPVGQSGLVLFGIILAAYAPRVPVVLVVFVGFQRRADALYVGSFCTSSQSRHS